MFYSVRMIANMEHSSGMYTTRRVYIGHNPTGKNADINTMLECIYLYGQNDHKNVQNCCSVSVGDVIELEDKLFIVTSLGFHQISKEIFDNMLNMNMLEIHRYAHLINS